MEKVTKEGVTPYTIPDHMVGEVFFSIEANVPEFAISLSDSTTNYSKLEYPVLFGKLNGSALIVDDGAYFRIDPKVAEYTYLMGGAMGSTAADLFVEQNMPDPTNLAVSVATASPSHSHDLSGVKTVPLADGWFKVGVKNSTTSDGTIFTDTATDGDQEAGGDGGEYNSEFATITLNDKARSLDKDTASATVSHNHTATIVPTPANADTVLRPKSLRIYMYMRAK